MLVTYFLRYAPLRISYSLFQLFEYDKVLSVTGGWNKFEDDEEEEEDDDDAANETKKDEEKKSLKEKMQQMQEITLMVQNILGMVAHIIESVANVFNFCVPFLSWLGFAVLCIATLILYHVPLR